jgi:hypothetical protein
MDRIQINFALEDIIKTAQELTELPDDGKFAWFSTEAGIIAINMVMLLMALMFGLKKQE